MEIKASQRLQAAQDEQSPYVRISQKVCKALAGENATYHAMNTSNGNPGAVIKGSPPDASIVIDAERAALMLAALRKNPNAAFRFYAISAKNIVVLMGDDNSGLY